MPYRFIDLFAGIGGFHLGLSKAGMECAFASELDKHARETYLLNHNIDESIFNDDIRKISPSDIPEHDVLCAGFPCQPFSQAGHKRGFEDGSNSERGNLFFCIADILEAKRPKAFILENVRHLLKHDEGKTFKVIKETLEALDYSVDFKVIKATEFGKPQHRPRIYIIGFDQQQTNIRKFNFPEPIPLKQTMSDIWEGDCDRDIGFTLRVGGRGSSIDDRRNWDSYRVNGEVKQLKPLQGKRMMGLPDDFILPKSITQAMKQLGNSVCVDVIEHLAVSVKNHLDGRFSQESELNRKGFNMAKNKGEWSELYAFFKLLVDNRLHFGSEHSTTLSDYVTVIDVAHNHSDIVYGILDSDIVFKKTNGVEIKRKKVSDIITPEKVVILLNQIRSGSGRSFDLPEINHHLAMAEIDSSVKGRSFDKGDLRISINNNGLIHPLSPVGIKSDLGAKPTILNASSATNFVFEVKGLKVPIDHVNGINTRSKIKDRLKEIHLQGGSLDFVGCELDIHTKNLRKIDSLMPNIIADILVDYYSGKASKISDLIDDEQIKSRVKDYLKAVLLGMFYTRDWDGNFESNGSILITSDGELQLYHVIKEHILKDYLYNHTKLDTPSSTRHRFGSLYTEGDKTYLKLNLQIRML
ncbi:HpaII family restriction endonuclease [Vibrio aestuarianus]|uniref:HpaII family restriction endonuclease n=1 Tax=Vibrio aestuarianus TaxID=28171 RepID=UPI00249B66C0|nr:HpaII family restriction endonuclease [Vibrio aestuarianus]WDS54556.1 HpaII family restriction endonuclease [Vibrio aestuarianus]